MDIVSICEEYEGLATSSHRNHQPGYEVTIFGSYLHHGLNYLTAHKARRLQRSEYLRTTTYRPSRKHTPDSVSYDIA